ncbi:MAG TPA: hypothetical protein VHM70_31280 [Polyangiaceae bacterium]|jgi:hypothetical protein|nr:hypothetical protein [Polyangiaceae bacterium]
MRRVALRLGVLLALWVLALWVLALSALARRAAADERGRVRIECPWDNSPSLDEVVARTRGELSALGLDVEVLKRSRVIAPDEELPALEAGVHGLIVFFHEEAGLGVLAWAPNGGRAVRLSFSAREMANAEVVAVRTAEALRTRWLEYEKESAAPLPPAVSDAAHSALPAAGTSKAEPIRAPQPTSKGNGDGLDEQANPENKEPRSDPSDAPNRQVSVALFGSVGAAFVAEALSVQHGSVEANLGLQYESLALALALDSSMAPFTLESSAGRVEGSRQRALLDVQAVFALAQDWSALIGMRVGLAHFRFNATAEPGFFAHDSSYDEATGALTAASVWWPAASLGVYTRGELSSLPRALSVRIDEQQVGRVAAPALALSLGVVGRFDLARASKARGP